MLQLQNKPGKFLTNLMGVEKRSRRLGFKPCKGKTEKREPKHLMELGEGIWLPLSKFWGFGQKGEVINNESGGILCSLKRIYGWRQWLYFSYNQLYMFVTQLKMIIKFQQNSLACAERRCLFTCASKSFSCFELLARSQNRLKVDKEISTLLYSNCIIHNT